MGAEHWERIKEVFHAALELSAEQRGSYLEEACGDESALRLEVESLLEAHGATSTFLGNSALEDVVTDEPWQGGWLGRRLGPYRIVRELGTGGMGAVFLAERADGSFEQNVAVKLIRPSWTGEAGESLVRRFMAERQILARLEHPHIARLFDGGSTDEGFPYLVMEHVDGMPIDVYCDLHRLTLKERLTLFSRVCSAVHYAHQNLVVHRDLKPGNILVNERREPKLLDFGIAKLMHQDLASEVALTRTSMLGPMTPEYASPEQLQGRPVSTMSDVYALGVLAYRLLSGYPPYRLDSRRPADMIRAVVERQVPRPSEAVEMAMTGIRTSAIPGEVSGLAPVEVSRRRNLASPARLVRSLVGDLDNLVGKALAKDPRQRYASAEQLSLEVDRYLEGLPISVRGTSLGYRLRKWVARHRAWATAAVLILVSLVLGVAVSTHLARVAQRERQLAERRFEDVRGLATSFLFDVHDEIARLPGSTGARQQLVEIGLRYLERLSQETGQRQDLMREVAEAYLRVGDVQGFPGGLGSLGDTAGALLSYRRALALADRLAAGADSLRLRAQAHSRIGDMLELTGDLGGAGMSYRTALELRQAAAAQLEPTVELHLELLTDIDRLGRLHLNAGRHEQALATFESGLELRQQLSVEAADDPRYQRELGLSLINLGDSQFDLGDPEAATASYVRALEIHQGLVDDATTDVEALRDLTAAHERLGETLLQGETATALEHFLAAREITQRLVAADALDSEVRRDLSVLENRIGDARFELGDAAGGIAAYRAALELREALAEADPGNVRSRRELAVSYYKMGQGTVTLAQSASAGGAAAHWRQARAWYRRSLALFEDMLAAELLTSPGDQAAPQELQQAIGRCDEALAALGES